VNQLALALPGIGAPTFDNYYGAAGNLAPSRLVAFAVAPVDTQIVLLGAAQSGKSHLLQAVCERAREHGIGAQYVSLRRTDATEWLDNANGTLIAVDDIDAISEPETALALFALLNRQHDARRAILCAGTSLPTVLPDLHSRLMRAEQLALPAMSDDDRRLILSHQARQAGIPLEPGAIEYLLRHHSRDLHALMTRLDQLHRLSLEGKRRITVAMVRG